MTLVFLAGVGVGACVVAGFGYLSLLFLFRDP